MQLVFGIHVVCIIHAVASFMFYIINVAAICFENGCKNECSGELRELIFEQKHETM